MGVVDAIERLRSAPERDLTPEQRRDVANLSEQLLNSNFDALLPDEHHEAVMPLVDVAMIDTNTRRPVFVPRYLMKEQGRSAAEELVGLELPQFKTEEEATIYLKHHDYTEHPSVSGFSKLAKRSELSVRDELAGQLLEGEVPIAPNRVEVITDPDAYLTKASELKKYKKELRAVRQALKSSAEYGDDVSDAMMLVTDIHMARVNEMLAELYPGLGTLRFQAEVGAFGDDSEAFVAAIDAISPVIPNNGGISNSLTNRLDRLRNGADTTRDEHSQISEATEQLANSLTPNPEQSASDKEFSDEEIEALKQEKFTEQDIAEGMRVVLKEWGLLSDQADYDPDRDGWAADGKWQVVISEEFDNHKVVVEKGIVAVPTGQNRTMHQMAPAGVVPLIDHELEHLLQREAARQDETGLAISKTSVRGPRASVIYEAGGKAREDASQADLFGQSQNPKPHYMRALQALLENGTEGDAMVAYFQSALEQNPNGDPKKLAMTATNTTMRLTRFGGINSQPLAYIESASVVAEMQDMSPADRRRTMISFGSYSLPDLVRLHEFGLATQVDESFIPQRTASEILTPWIRAKMAERANSEEADII